VKVNHRQNSEYKRGTLLVPADTEVQADSDWHPAAAVRVETKVLH
jgi:hypothetical protein